MNNTSKGKKPNTIKEGVKMLIEQLEEVLKTMIELRKQRLEVSKLNIDFLHDVNKQLREIKKIL